MFVASGHQPIQHGRVVALRITDVGRLSSAFKAATYLGKYDDMANVSRFLTKMIAAGHSYEPIRGETVLFLYLGVGKPNYDHIITYSVGRTTRIAGGQRANLPWGFEVATETKDRERHLTNGTRAVREVIEVVKGLDEETDKEQMQAERNQLPVGFIMPPFLFEFSEEALVHIFTQRLWEPGAQGATVELVMDMWNCVHEFDPEKWDQIFEYHGPHTQRWAKAMRTLRDKGNSLVGLMEKAGMEITPESIMRQANLPLYDLTIRTVGKLPPSMWDKQK